MSVATSTAIAIAAGVGAAGTIGSSLIGAHAATSAADKQVAAAQQAQQTIQQAGTTANNTLSSDLSQQQKLLAPYVSEGTSGLAALNSAVAPGGSLTSQFSFNPANISQDPSYQFQLQQGLQSVQRAAAAGGTLNSGGTLKALDQYAQGVTAGYENQDYTQALNTYSTNRNATLQNISLPLQTGQYGTSDLLNALQSYGQQFSANTLGTANQVANYGTQGANAAAAGTIGQANAYSGALGGLSNSAQTFALLSALTAPNGGQLANTGGTGALTVGANGQAVPFTGATAPTAFTTTTSAANPYAVNYYGAPPVSAG